MLTPDVAYVKIGTLKVADVASYVRAAAGAKGLIIDIRNYPSDFPIFALGQSLVSQPVDFVRFTIGDVSNPGAFHWGEMLGLTPQPTL